jgi:pyocin large subunit-like protein
VAILAIGFASPSDRADHFKKHGMDFGATSQVEYEQMAVAFLNRRKGAHIFVGTRRSNGDIIRFDRISQAFAVMGHNGIVKTFYKPDPEWHGFRSNWAYFRNERRK